MAAPTQSSKRDSRSRPATSGSLSAVTYTRSARQPLVALKRTLFPGSKAANGWDPATDMPSQAGRVAIVTGGNAGIGFETVRGLLRKGASVYIASRPHQRSANAIERLRADIKEQGSGGEVKLLPCDVSDLASVTRAANEFLRQEKSLHILVCNAGISVPPSANTKSAQGYDITLATNVLGQQLLIEKLIDVLTQTAATSGQDKARVCIVSSGAHNLHHPLGFDPRDPEYSLGVPLSLGLGGRYITIPFREGGKTRSIIRYGHSKFLNAVLAKKLQRQYGNRGIAFTSVDPGTNNTDILRDRNWIGELIWNNILMPTLLFEPKFGALSQLYACTSPEGALLGGQFLMPWACVTAAALPTGDTAMQDSFYEWCQQQHAKQGF